MKNRVKELRLARRLTLRELADNIGYLDHSAISRIENGGRNLSDNDIVALCNFFNVSADYLLGNTDNPNAQILTVADADGSITKIEYELLDKMKGFTVEDFQKVNEYVDFLKSKKEDK